MTVKLVLLKSGEDLIADIQEMVKDDLVIGYFLTKPCIVKMRNPNVLTEEVEQVYFNFYNIRSSILLI